MGQGAYGDVWRCYLQTGLVTEIEVAVKSCKFVDEKITDAKKEVEDIHTLYVVMFKNFKYIFYRKQKI